ncbi:MAG: hypothetical protein KGV44_07935 [Flavobacteriaceae bacterium]|nr:hypothetical protein [Flavobacteriaceae bacterium]
MIDLVTLYFKDKNRIEDVTLKNNTQHLTTAYSVYKDQFTYPIRGNFENIRLNIANEKAYLENSIHKYYNIKNGFGNQNCNDFSFYDFCNACKMLEKEVDFDINDTYLTRFEFGLNIKLDDDPSNFIENNVLMYKYKTPCYDPKYKSREKIKKFSLKEYEIKLYNKSLQYGLKSNILRVEVKYKSKRVFQKLGIYNLNDLKNKETMRNVFNDFIHKVKEVIIIDNYRGNSQMSKKKEDLCIKYTNPNFWKETKTKSKNSPSYHNRKFLNLIYRHKLDSNRNHLISLLTSKFNELMSCST